MSAPLGALAVALALLAPGCGAPAVEAPPEPAARDASPALHPDGVGLAKLTYAEHAAWRASPPPPGD